MMPECDLDDNDPLSDYLKRAPMISAAKKPTVTSCICCLGMPLHNIYKFDSINSITGNERRGNINHSEIDTENDKLEASEDVSKQHSWILFVEFAFCLSI